MFEIVVLSNYDHLSSYLLHCPQIVEPSLPFLTLTLLMKLSDTLSFESAALLISPLALMPLSVCSTSMLESIRSSSCLKIYFTASLLVNDPLYCLILSNITIEINKRQKHTENNMSPF